MNMQEVTIEIEVLEARIAPSNVGYEGQPGNQSANGGGGNGPTGYEGQPGNQGG